MKARHLGHSAVELEMASGLRILFDPFISGNPHTKVEVSDLRPDVIVLTHGHGDHLGDTVELAKQSDALVIAPFELAEYLELKGLKTHGMGAGGAYTFDFGRVKYYSAIHSSSIMDGDDLIYLGLPCSVVLECEGKVIYHAGDTALYSDMKLIGDRHEIDLAFVPIGDNFTMGPDDAAVAVEWVGAKRVVPIHYNTFPVIKQNPDDFVALVTSAEVLVPDVDEWFDV